MSVDISFFIEVRDKEGKWHLVKWYADGEFDTEDPTKYDFEKVVEINGKRMVEKYEFNPGLSWRDELGCYSKLEGIRTYSLPNDISEELDVLITEHEAVEREDRIKWYGSDKDFNYRGKFSCIDFSDMSDIAIKRFDEWKERTLKRVKDKQLEEITKRIEHLEKTFISGEKTSFKPERIEEDYEETIDYYFDDALFDVISLMKENREVFTKASGFTGDRWLETENIRVIYYFT